MAEQRYRFGGPIPESVQTLRERRRYRDSSLYAGVKKIRRERGVDVRATSGSAQTRQMVEGSPSPTAAAPHGAPALPTAVPTAAGPR